MCTVTIHRTGERLLVTMNRDESRHRGPEIPPARHTASNSTSWVAPADSDKGGTWFAMNETGLVAGLLNRYQDAAPTPPAAARSRGEIIPAIMGNHAVAEAEDRLASGGLDLETYPAFTLVVADLESGVRLDWRGSGRLEASTLHSPWHVVTSSFFEPDNVLPWRQNAFAGWISAGASFYRGIPTYHLLQPSGKESLAPMMARDFSSTRSITQATIDWRLGTASLRYAPVLDATPDLGQFAREHRLALRKGPPL